MKLIGIPEQTLAHLLLCSFRYSLGRKTYITGMCREWLETYWKHMPNQYREQIRDDIRHAIEHDLAGHACDVSEWKRVLDLPIAASPTHRTATNPENPPQP
jgi:hypothetical protein